MKRTKIPLGETLEFSFSYSFSSSVDSIKVDEIKRKKSLFVDPIGKTVENEKRDKPQIITSTIAEVQRRGMSKVGIYRYIYRYFHEGLPLSTLCLWDMVFQKTPLLYLRKNILSGT